MGCCYCSAGSYAARNEGSVFQNMSAICLLHKEHADTCKSSYPRVVDIFVSVAVQFATSRTESIRSFNVRSKIGRNLAAPHQQPHLPPGKKRQKSLGESQAGEADMAGCWIFVLYCVQRYTEGGFRVELTPIEAPMRRFLGETGRVPLAELKKSGAAGATRLRLGSGVWPGGERIGAWRGSMRGRLELGLV